MLFELMYDMYISGFRGWRIVQLCWRYHNFKKVDLLKIQEHEILSLPDLNPFKQFRLVMWIKLNF